MNSPISPDEITQCIKTLESILGDRRVLSNLTEEDRKSLLMAAGRVSRPDKHEIDKLQKKARKERKRKAREADRTVRATTGIREARR